MVPHVSERLFRLFRDLPKTIPLKEVEFQGVPLFFRELLAQAIEEISGSQFISEQGFAPDADLFFIKFLGIVVLPVRQVLPAVHRPMVGDLNDPGGCRPFARFKEFRFLEQQKEDLLTQIFSFCFTS